MKNTLLILKIIALGLIALGAMALFWVYLIPGIVLGLLRLDQRHKWLSGVIALLIVGILRFSTGTWQIKNRRCGSGTMVCAMHGGITSMGGSEHSGFGRMPDPAIFQEWFSQSFESQTNLTHLSVFLRASAPRFS